MSLEYRVRTKVYIYVLSNVPKTRNQEATRLSVYSSVFRNTVNQTRPTWQCLCRWMRILIFEFCSPALLSRTSNRCLELGANVTMRLYLTITVVPYHLISRLSLFIESLSLVSNSSSSLWIPAALCPQACPHVFFIQQWIHLCQCIQRLLQKSNGKSEQKP